jgi:hypothetical protein
MTNKHDASYLLQNRVQQCIVCICYRILFSSGNVLSQSEEIRCGTFRRSALEMCDETAKTRVDVLAYVNAPSLE